MAELQICLVGAGRIAAIHATNLGQIAGARIAAVVDPNVGAASTIAERSGARAFSDLESARAAIRFDAAVIAAPSEFHAQLVETCVGWQLPTFCEKPLDLDLARVDACVAAVARAGVPVVVGFHRRFDPAREAMRDAVRSGELGRVMHSIHVSRDPRLPPESFIRHSGGLIHDMLIHDLDELAWLFGGGAVEVTAMLSRSGDEAMLSRNNDHDGAGITVHFQGGPICHVSGARRSPHGFEQRLEIFGTEGSVACPSVADGMILRAGPLGLLAPKLLDHFPQRYAAAYRREMAHFVDVAHGNVAPACTVADARRSLKLADLARLAAGSGTVASAATLDG